MTLRVAIVIVNYRTAALAADCVRSLAADAWVRGNCRVLIVDNASPDDSLQRLERLAGEFGGRMQVLAAEANHGFAAGNNVALRQILAQSETSEFVLLLNPDTVVESGAVEKLVRHMEQRDRTGIAGGRLTDVDGGQQCAAHRFPSPLGELEGMARLGVVSRMLARWQVSPRRLEADACDWVSGAFLMVRLRVIEEIGLLDEGYFLYFEEVDWCWRAKQAGWEVCYVPEAGVLHLEGASTGVKSRQRRPGYWYASRRRYFRRTTGLLGWLAADACWVIGWLAFQVKWLLGRGAPGDPKWFAWDLLIGDLRALAGDE